MAAAIGLRWKLFAVSDRTFLSPGLPCLVEVYLL